ncbi:pilus assembly protein CpaE [Asticcacaulis biprosthecium C19]|uniref:Pilus assembly protein CpaE n=1 Tax=Asticcacaulis biprosthecium C19 TaxID=715226 RepID=F4QJ56_9CAUL|nr:CpaE family protein [Asticcacaulis biprosthecium]EGF91887.1 pilus assembly protein CpaE [Asticcacaulis biprosthecium C19]
MPQAKHSDPFDNLDDLDDEFVDFRAKLDAADEFELDQPAAYAPDADPFADDYSPQESGPVRQQALAQPPSLAKRDLGLRETLAAGASLGGGLGDDDIGAISIPRINIHFFPDSEASLQACDTAALDRRMSRAQCTVKRGGIFEAMDTYRHEPTPSLIVVESGARGRDLLDQLGQLAEVCDGNTKVVVVGAHNDISLYRELIRQGVSEYVVSPLQPLSLIKTIAGLFNDPETPFVGRTIAFVGARGGAGSSSIAHNFAFNLSESMSSNTVIVDYDLPFGTAGLDFNQDPPHGLADALNEPDRLDSVLLDRMLTKCTERLSLFSSPAALDQDYTADPDAFDEVTRKIRSAAPFIVMDLPHVWTPWLRQNLVAADDVVIVATPDLASLRNAKNIIDLLKHSRPNDTPPRLVLNQMETPGRPEIPVKDFTAALGIEPSALIPFDAKLFGSAANNGQMIAEVGPTSKAAEALGHLTAAITGRTPEPTKAKKASSSSFLSNLFKK